MTNLTFKIYSSLLRKFCKIFIKRTNREIDEITLAFERDITNHFSIE